ncbi:MAG: hypothetical protein ABR538_01575 [Candidatus Binatia bacterium]
MRKSRRHPRPPQAEKAEKPEKSDKAPPAVAAPPSSGNRGLADRLQDPLADRRVARPAGRLAAALPLSALVVVALFAIRRLDDFDTWWHLAAGRWIVRHGSIPQTDVLSFTVPGNEWINLQWLYDVLLYGFWSVGGDSGLVLVSAACFVATFALLARHLGQQAGAVTSTLLLLWVAATVNERFLIRPEMASFPLLAAVQLVLFQGRSRPERLPWLVPLMMLWANLHSLFILGVAAVACAIGGAMVAEIPLLPEGWRRDSAWPAAARRRLLLWGAASIAATLANPYFVRAILFPLELMTRIDGSSTVYSAIGEFRPPFSGYFPTFAIGSYQAFIFTFVGLAVIAGLLRAMAPSRRRGAPLRADETPPVQEGGFDLGALAFAAALAWLSLLARRNVGIFAVGALPFVGAAAAVLVAALPKAWTAASGAAVRAASALVLAGAVAISGLVVTNDWYASTGETHEFGLGTFASNFQPRAVEFFREQGLPGPLYNDMTAGGYLTWDDPTGKGVYVDGRLEVYDTPFFSAYLSNLSNIAAWKKDADARGIQSVMVFHRWGNRHGFLRALLSQPDWHLVYFDETVATVVRATGREEVVAKARQAFSGGWRARNEAIIGSPRLAMPWQWNVDSYTGQLAYARLLETLGERKSVLPWLEKAISTGLPTNIGVEVRMQAANYLASSAQHAQARVHLEKAVEADPSSAEARSMLRKLDEIQR